MTEEKFHKTREMIEKILSGFDEVGSYGLALVENDIYVHYYLQVENVRHAPGQRSLI